MYSKTYIFNFLDMTLIDCLDTCENPAGLCELAMSETAVVGGGVQSYVSASNDNAVDVD